MTMRVNFDSRTMPSGLHLPLGESSTSHLDREKKHPLIGGCCLEV
jgi:hypothetical protein